MHKLFISLALLLSVHLSVLAQSKITKEELKSHLEYLASEKLQGRYPAAPGGIAAAEYIRKEFKLAGLLPAEDDGFQYFEIITGIELGDQNSLVLGDEKKELNKDFIPLAFSGNGELKAGVCFVGFGLPEDTVSGRKSSYEGVDVAGKWVLILRGEPQAGHGNMFSPNADLNAKVRLAKKHKAAGVLFVSDSKMSPEDKLSELAYRREAKQDDIPVIHIKRELANRILQRAGQYPVNSQAASIRKNKKPMSFDTRVTMHASTDVQYKREKARNVVGILQGSDPKLKDEYIIIGAHYDHLGLGGWGSGSRVPDTSAVHYGADDNASGTVAVLELAEYFGTRKSRPKRSMIFIAFDAEEMGLLGSSFYAENAEIDIAKTYIMLNFDMLGRLPEEKPEMSINGTGTAEEFNSILEEFKKKTKINLSFIPGGYGASDHSSFYVKDIPVLFFTTGAHEDYHTPADTPDKINYEGMEALVNYIADIAEYFANREEPLTFKESGSKFDPSKRVTLKATLGIMPGFGATDVIGLRIDGISEGGPAEAAGLQKGDVIKKLNHKDIKDIYEYMDVLKELSPGQTTIVEVEREGERKVFPVQL